MRQRILQLRKRIKEEKPLIHCITNPISIHDCANVVLAVGARTAAFLPGCEDNIAKEMTDSIEAGVWSGVEMELNGRSGNYLAAAVLGTALMGIAGEEAEKISRGPGSFQVNLLDEIYGLSDRQLLDLLKIEMY